MVVSLFRARWSRWVTGAMCRDVHMLKAQSALFHCSIGRLIARSLPLDLQPSRAAPCKQRFSSALTIQSNTVSRSMTEQIPCHIKPCILGVPRGQVRGSGYAFSADVPVRQHAMGKFCRAGQLLPVTSES